jgi:hypothetical protein
MTSSPPQKTDLRRFLITFSSTLIGLIAVIGIMSLFSIWSMNRAYIKADINIEKIHYLAEEGLLAQIDFKVQVQEWKNILLRGSDESVRSKYLEAFEIRETGVEKHLANLTVKTDDAELNDYSNYAKELVTQHQKLAITYRDALASVPNLSPDNARKVDKLVLGADRDLEANISTLSQRLSAFSKSRSETLVKQMSERYKTLRTVLLTIISLSLVVTMINLYTILRSVAD